MVEPFSINQCFRLPVQEKFQPLNQFHRPLSGQQVLPLLQLRVHRHLHGPAKYQGRSGRNMCQDQYQMVVPGLLWDKEKHQKVNFASIDFNEVMEIY